MEKKDKKPLVPVQSDVDRKYDVERCPVCGHIVRNSEFREETCKECGQLILLGKK